MKYPKSFEPPSYSGLSHASDKVVLVTSTMRGLRGDAGTATGS